MFTSVYLTKVYASLSERYADQPEFLQAIEEFLSSMDLMVDNDPRIEKNAIIERIVEPERIIKFRVSWVDDAGNVQINRVSLAVLSFQDFNGFLGHVQQVVLFHGNGFNEYRRTKRFLDGFKVFA